MLLVDDILISDLVIESRFTCQLSACKGCCCQLGDRGSPLQRNEIEEITKIKDKLLKLMSPPKKELLLESNFFIKDGKHIELQCLPNGQCIFSQEDSSQNNDEPLLSCLIEKLWFEKECTFRKPIFCHTFPLVVDTFYNKKCLNMELRHECSDAIGYGNLVIESCKDSLLRIFSKEWYDKAVKMIKDERKKLKLD